MAERQCIIIKNEEENAHPTSVTLHYKGTVDPSAGGVSGIGYLPNPGVFTVPAKYQKSGYLYFTLANLNNIYDYSGSQYRDWATDYADPINKDIPVVIHLYSPNRGTGCECDITLHFNS